MAHHKHQGKKPAHGASWNTFPRIVLILFLAVASVILIYEHHMHLFTSSSLLISLIGVCIFMHLFMHGGHDSNGGDGTKSSRKDGS